VRNDGDERMPWMHIGGTHPDVAQGNKDWPLFPLAMINDIPFCLSPGYALGGFPEPPTIHLDYCENNCTIRRAPLQPTTSPILAAEALMASERWRRLFKTEDDGASTQYLLRLQALCSLNAMTRKPPDERALNPSCVPKADTERAWAAYTGDQNLTGARWDALRQAFAERPDSPAHR